MTVKFFAAGAPQPQGSVKGFVVNDKRTGKPRAILTSDNSQLRPWRLSVTYAARLAMEQAGLSGRLVVDSPVHLDATFVMPAPKWAAQKMARGKIVRCTKKPDLSKLLRGLEDALTGIVYQDDALIMDEHIVKRYAVGVEEPGVHVLVTVQQPETAAIAAPLPLDEDPPPPVDLDNAAW